MKIFLSFLCSLIGLGILFLIGLSLLNNFAVKSETNQRFMKGTVSDSQPDGAYKGIVDFPQSIWKGKKFNISEHTGLNLLGDSESFPFQYYKTKGIVDTGLDVIRLDYAAPTNPFWLRRITDEIVEDGEGKYLGRVYLRLIPGKPFLVGFFRLEKM